MLLAFDTTIAETEELRPRKSDAWFHWWWVVRSTCFNWTYNEKLERLWAYTIVANTLTLATDRYPISEVHADAVVTLNSLFLGICLAEVTIKMIGLGPRQYLSTGWHVADFLLVRCDCVTVVSTQHFEL